MPCAVHTRDTLFKWYNWRLLILLFFTWVPEPGTLFELLSVIFLLSLKTSLSVLPSRSFFSTFFLIHLVLFPLQTINVTIFFSLSLSLLICPSQSSCFSVLFDFKSWHLLYADIGCLQFYINTHLINSSINRVYGWVVDSSVMCAHTLYE